jgi:hypothetical protein
MASGYGRYLRIYWINCRRHPKWGVPPAWGLGGGITISHRGKKKSRCGMLHRTSDLGGSCEHDIETSGLIKGGEFLEQRNDCQLAPLHGLKCSSFVTVRQTPLNRLHNWSVACFMCSVICLRLQINVGHAILRQVSVCTTNWFTVKLELYLSVTNERCGQVVSSSDSSSRGPRFWISAQRWALLTFRGFTQSWQASAVTVP